LLGSFPAEYLSLREAFFADIVIPFVPVAFQKKMRKTGRSDQA